MGTFSLADPELVQKHVAAADAAVERGDLSAALASLKEGHAVLFHEAPNYHLLVRIAEVQCMQGDEEIGLRTLAAFRCMLSVDAGREPCFLPAATGHAPRPNPVLTSECAATMCGEAYLAEYEDPTPETLTVIKDLEQQATRVERACTTRRPAE
jgi:hypothetical protein